MARRFPPATLKPPDAGTAPPPVADQVSIDDALMERLWDVKDVARYLKLSERSVYDLPGRPRVKLAITAGRALVRYVPAEVRAWTKARLTHSVLRPSEPAAGGPSSSTPPARSHPNARPA